MNALRLAVAMLALLPMVSPAQWSVETDAGDDGDDNQTSSALGRNDNGDTLRVRRTRDDAVEVVFSLRPGLTPLADGCPSYRVDTENARTLVSNGDMCSVTGRTVTFMLGRVDEGKLDSEALLEMMNGSRIRFIYHMRGAGYDETAFSLSGSKQAINEVLGRNVIVNGH